MIFFYLKRVAFMLYFFAEVNVQFPKIEELELNFKGIQAIHENLLKWILASAYDSIKILKIDGPVPFICDTFIESLFKEFPMRNLQEFSFQKARQVNKNNLNHRISNIQCDLFS